MAFLSGGPALQGNAGNISFYTRADMPGKIIARRKGGASKQKVKNAPGMEGTRRVMSEFGGRSVALGLVRQAISPLLAYTDVYFTGTINKHLKEAQQMDTESPYGQRSVCLSRAPWLLEGLTLNRLQLFDDIVRGPLAADINQQTGTAILSVPPLQPGRNLVLSNANLLWYRVECSMGMVPDLYFTPYGYQPAAPAIHGPVSFAASAWWVCTQNSPAHHLPLALPGFSGVPQDNSLLLAVAICFGQPDGLGGIRPLRWCAAGKILALA